MILNEIDNAYVGSEQVDKIYLGGDEVWSATHAPDGSDDINYTEPLTCVILKAGLQVYLRYAPEPDATAATDYMKSIYYSVNGGDPVKIDATTSGSAAQTDDNIFSPTYGYRRVNYQLMKGNSISFSVGDKIQFWGTGDGSWANKKTLAYFVNTTASGTFSAENGGMIFWYGNVNSLLCSPEEFAQNHNGNAGEYSFYGLYRTKTGQTFSDEYITSAATINYIGGKTGKHILLPEPLNGVQPYQYAYMFWGTNLLVDLTLPTEKVPIGPSGITAYDHLFFFDYNDTVSPNTLNPTPRLNKIECMAKGQNLSAPGWISTTSPSYYPQTYGTFIMHSTSDWIRNSDSGVPQGWQVEV